MEFPATDAKTSACVRSKSQQVVAFHWSSSAAGQWCSNRVQGRRSDVLVGPLMVCKLRFGWWANFIIINMHCIYVDKCLFSFLYNSSVWLYKSIYQSIHQYYSCRTPSWCQPVFFAYWYHAVHLLLILQTPECSAGFQPGVSCQQPRSFSMHFFSLWPQGMRTDTCKLSGGYNYH